MATNARARFSKKSLSLDYKNQCQKQNDRSLSTPGTENVLYYYKTEQ